MSTEWRPRSGEFEILFDQQQYDLYRRCDRRCLYHSVRWPLLRGRGRYGEFPLVVAREHFRSRGYTVWAAEPELPDDGGFVLVSYPGKRRQRHRAYTKMEAFFDSNTLKRLNAAADATKRKCTKGAGGGDPDLFVFRDSERFFVEVKWADAISPKQHVTFPLIEELCQVDIRVARIRPFPALPVRGHSRETKAS